MEQTFQRNLDGEGENVFNQKEPSISGWDLPALLIVDVEYHVNSCHSKENTLRIKQNFIKLCHRVQKHSTLHFSLGNLSFQFFP